MENNVAIHINATTRQKTKEWYNDKGELHREGDLPARIEQNGASTWYKHGIIHRGDNKPARIDSDGTKFWYIDGKVSSWCRS